MRRVKRQCPAIRRGVSLFLCEYLKMVSIFLMAAGVIFKALTEGVAGRESKELF